MADQVEGLLAAERELAADLSHRLRTPLTVLRLNTASLGDGPAADQTRAAVGQLEGEVDQIIRTAREQRTAVGTLPAGCDAAEVIRERMAFWSALAEDEGREVRTAGADRPVRVPVRGPIWWPRWTRCSAMCSGTRPRARLSLWTSTVRMRR